MAKTTHVMITVAALVLNGCSAANFEALVKSPATGCATLGTPWGSQRLVVIGQAPRFKGTVKIGADCTVEIDGAEPADTR